MADHCDCLLAGKKETNYKGSLEASIMFVGESPGYEELKEGVPFVGRSGRLLTNTLDRQLIPREICFFANSARCMIEKDNLTQKEVNSILKSCRTNLETIIYHINPKLIVPLGAIALQQVMNMKGIKKARGNYYWSDEFHCWVLPNWHPAYILRNANEEDNFIRVFRTVREFIENDFQVKDDDDFIYMETDSIRDLLDGGFQRSEDDSCYVTAIDTETQGLKWFTDDSITISYSVAANDSEGWNIILYEECAINDPDKDRVILVERGGTKKSREVVGVGIKKSEGFDRKVAELAELVARKDIQKYYMNQKYEMHRFEQLGIDVTNPEQFQGNLIDISLLAHAFDAPRYSNANLGYLLESYCNISSAYKEEWTETELEDMLTQLRVDRDKFNRRACFDAISTLRVAVAQIKELAIDRETLNYYVNFAHPIEMGILYELERNGVQVDEFQLPVVSEEIADHITETVEKFKEMCPEPVKGKHYDKFVLTRRTILMDCLFKYEDKDEEIDIGFGITPLELSPKTKLPKVNKAVLKVLLDRDINEKAKELIRIYQEWGEYHTLRSRYIKQIDENIAPDGKLYPTYSLTYTSSGRTGARRPSVQNFPKRSKPAALIRRLIVAPDGKKLLETDHSMSELRWTAEVSGDRVMKEIFKREGDIHLFTGAELAGNPVDIGTKASMVEQLNTMGLNGDSIKQMRQNAKAVNFGLIYLMSAYGLRNYAYQGFGVRLSDYEAVQWREGFFNLYPDIAPWHEREIAEMEKRGCVTTVFGRRIPIPNIYSDDKQVQREAERFGINVLIQGPSSDYTLMGGDNVIKRPSYKRNECKPVLFIHDSIVWEVDIDKVNTYAGVILDGMTNIETKSKFGFTPSVPFVAEAEEGYNLADMLEYNPEEE
jgi:uracil-DNA glycosylase family 4